MKIAILGATGHIAKGKKDIYYSVHHKAHQLGFQPKYTSLDCIREECQFLVHK